MLLVYVLFIYVQFSTDYKQRHFEHVIYEVGLKHKKCVIVLICRPLSISSIQLGGLRSVVGSSRPGKSPAVKRC